MSNPYGRNDEPTVSVQPQVPEAETLPPALQTPPTSGETQARIISLLNGDGVFTDCAGATEPTVINGRVTSPDVNVLFDGENQTQLIPESTLFNSGPVIPTDQQTPGTNVLRTNTASRTTTTEPDLLKNFWEDL